MRLQDSTTKDWKVWDTALLNGSKVVQIEFDHYDVLEFRAGPTENAEHFSIINVDDITISECHKRKYPSIEIQQGRIFKHYLDWGPEFYIEFDISLIKMPRQGGFFEKTL